MPVSGSEQPGIIARHPSISCAGVVPIKKRKFPSWNTSLPPHEQQNSVENRQSGPCQDSSLLNGSVVKTTSHAQSDASKNHFVDVKKERISDSNGSTFSSAQESIILTKTKLQEPNIVKKEDIPDNSSTFTSVNETISLPKTKLQEPSINVGLGAVDNVDSREKVMMALKPVQEVVPSRVELHIAPKEASSVSTGKVSQVGKNNGVGIKLERSAISTDSVVAPKEPFVPLSDLRTDEAHKFPDYDAASLSLSLTKEKCYTPCESDGDVDLHNDDSLVRSDRCNWDLNTTMDEWEAPVDTSGVPETVVFVGLTGKVAAHDIKPSIDLLGIGDGKGKHILDAADRRSDLLVSSSSGQHHKAEDSLRLSLGNSFSQSNCRGKFTGLSTLIASPCIASNVKSLRLSFPAGNAKAVGHPIIKSEPCHERAKTDQVVVEGRSTGLSDPGTAKAEWVARHNVGAAMVSHMNPQKVVMPTSVKSEPLIDGNKETYGTMEPISQKTVGKILQQGNLSAIKTIPSQAKYSCPSVGLVSHSGLLSWSGVMLHYESSSLIQKEPQMDMEKSPVTCKIIDQVALESNSLHEEIKERNAFAGTSNTCMPEYRKSDGPKRGKLKINEGPRCEGSGSDEKINISNDMLEEDSYGSDYESDGNQVPIAPTPTEQKKLGKCDGGYEDGEVQASLAHALAEGSRGDDKETKKVIPAEFNSKSSNSLGCPGDSNITSAYSVEKDIKTDGYVGMNDIHIKECITSVSVLGLKPDQTEEESTCMQESLSHDLSAVAFDEKRHMGGDDPVDQYESNDVKHRRYQELSSCSELTGGEGSENILQSADGHIIGNDRKGNGNDSSLPTGAPVSSKDAAKDSDSAGNQSRIIHLPRGSTNMSPCKTRPFPEGSFGRGRYVDYEGEKFHPRRNREEFYNDGPRKFLRDRFQGQPFRNSRQNYGRGRGRGYGRSNSRTDWDSDRTFMSGNYNGPADFRFPRHKQNLLVGDEELECNSYLREPDEGLVGTGRGGRKPVSDDLPSFRQLSSRRLSPGVRNRPATRGVPAFRRVPRNISPNRCEGEDGSDLVGLRHSENFVRGMPDMEEPMYTRPQPSFEGLDSQYVRGDRNFSSGQKRPGPPRIRSKSPDRSRTRSPGVWSSPQRSPDGFDGVSEFTQRGSPVLFRMGRMRSPECPCFPDEMVGRRRGSPPFITRPNEMRKMNAGRAHGHLRSAIPNRNPSNRVLPRNTRRFDALEGRERTENDNYIGGVGPLRSGRFPELGADASGCDVRRNFSERHGGIVRPFRPSGGTDGESFHCHIEDGPTRPFRLCAEPDSELTVHNNLRDREFDRRIKNRPVIAPRRLRNIEDPDGGGVYRQGGGQQVWNNDGLDEDTHVKRRRF